MRIIDDRGHPMMADNEIQIIDNLIELHQPKRCLEWGSGNSTIYFPKKHSSIESWTAMEHNRTYFELLHDKFPKGVDIKVYEDMKKYVNDPLGWGLYDFILVDGQERDACLDVAMQIAKDDACILLHDAGRIESKEMLIKYKDYVTILSEGEKMQPTGFYAHRGLALFKKYV